MIAAAAQALAGHGPEAESWAKEVRKRDPRLTREDFFHAFPFKSETVHARVSAALKSLGF